LILRLAKFRFVHLPKLRRGSGLIFGYIRRKLCAYETSQPNEITLKKAVKGILIRRREARQQPIERQPVESPINYRVFVSF